MGDLEFLSDLSAYTTDEIRSWMVNIRMQMNTGLIAATSPNGSAQWSMLEMRKLLAEYNRELRRRANGGTPEPLMRSWIPEPEPYT